METRSPVVTKSKYPVWMLLYFCLFASEEQVSRPEKKQGFIFKAGTYILHAAYTAVMEQRILCLLNALCLTLAHKCW